MGFLTSLVVHISIICGHFPPPEVLIIILNYGLLILVSLRLIISRKMNEGLKVQEVVKLVFNSCPKWLKIVAGVIITYGVVVSASFLTSAFYHVYANYEVDTKENLEIFKSRFYIGLSALWIFIYAFEFTTLYCYRKIRKKQMHVDDTSILNVENANIKF